jgi:hypothetical protein
MVLGIELKALHVLTKHSYQLSYSEKHFKYKFMFLFQQKS